MIAVRLELVPDLTNGTLQKDRLERQIIGAAYRAKSNPALVDEAVNAVVVVVVAVVVDAAATRNCF